MPVQNAGNEIRQTVEAWEGIVAQPHRYGGVEWVMGKREIGHIHGDALVDVPFPKTVREELVAAGAAEPHHVLPESGWVSLWLRRSTDVPRAIALLERSYGLAKKQKERMGTY
jgi:hypothetical protein